MAWSTPMTAVAGSVFTAAQFNQFVRDNFLETAPAKASVSTGQVIVSAGANSIAARQWSSAAVGTSESTGTTGSFVDLTTAGPAVTLTTGSRVLVLVEAQITNSGGSGIMGVDVSGASTVAASPTTSLALAGATTQSAAYTINFSGLTAGSNTFTAKYRAGTGGTASFAQRRILVMPIS